jgi:outer membrane protein TolC
MTPSPKSPVIGLALLAAGQNSSKAGASRCDARGRRSAPSLSREMKNFVLHPALLAAAALLTSCAMGPDFQKPAAPPVHDYATSPVSTASSTTNVAGGKDQRFVTDQDIAGDWWTLFQSKPLNDLIERALTNNPDIKAAQAALTAARETMLAQRGAYFPGIEGGFSASRQKTSELLAPIPNANEFQYNLFTPQVSVSYVPDVFGLNRRTVESLKAQEEQARFAWLAAGIALSANVVAAAIQEASLRGKLRRPIE